MISNGYGALRDGAALLDLDGRGLLSAGGEDRARLLHAMTTNHVQEMQPGDFRYVFFLNAQGRILADAHLLCREDTFLIDTESGRREFLYRHLDQFIIADDVAIEDVSARFWVAGLEGPGAAALLEKIGAPVPQAGRWSRWNSALISAATVTGAPGVRICAPAAEQAQLRQALAGAGAVEAGADDIRAVRLENARPRYGEEITDAYIPHETRILRAVHFSKGCYLGQEIVERVRSRGHPNRLLVQLQIDAVDAPPSGTKIDEEAGEIRSAAYSPAMRATFALAYVRSPLAAPGTPLRVAGVPAVVTPRVPD